jgi:hypothetical protein
LEYINVEENTCENEKSNEFVKILNIRIWKWKIWIGNYCWTKNIGFRKMNEKPNNSAEENWFEKLNALEYLKILTSENKYDELNSLLKINFKFEMKSELNISLSDELKK